MFYKIKMKSVKDNILTENNKNIYLYSLAILLLLFFIMLEIRYPNYFLNDDNKLYWLTALTYNFESIKSGTLPIFNFHQFLGYPWLSNGQTMVLYPFGYLATLLSTVLFGNYLASIDIFVILHLVAGALAFYVLLKFLGLNEKGSFFGAVTWALNSFTIYTSTGWIFISAHSVFFPLIIYLSLKLFKQFSYKTFIFLVICRTLLFLLGHPQYFIYSVIFEFFTVVLILVFSTNLKEEKKEFVKFFKIYVLSYICTTILSLPLLLPMVHQMNISSTRNSKLGFAEFSSWSYNIKQWILGFFYPFSTSVNSGILYVLKYSSYIGYLSVFFLIVCIIKYFMGQYSKNIRIKISVFLIVGAIAFLWATSIAFNHIIYIIPILNRFRWPFKLEFYVNFYLITIASMGFNAYFEQIARSNKRKLQNIIFVGLILIQIIDFSDLYMLFPQRGFDITENKITKEEPLVNEIYNGRIISFKDYYSPTNMEVSDYIGSNFASLYGFYHFGGYEPMLSEDSGRVSLYLNYDSIMYLYKSLWTSNRINKLIDYFREWGVEWYIVNKDSTLKEKLPFEKFYEDDKRTVYLDSQAKPFFYWKESENDDGVTWDIKINSICLNTSSNKQSYLVVNFLYNPFFKVYMDEKSVEIKRDQIGRMMILVPKGEHSIVIKYCDPYFSAGTYIALLFVLSGLIYAVLCIRTLPIRPKQL